MPPVRAHRGHFVEARAQRTTGPAPTDGDAAASIVHEHRAVGPHAGRHPHSAGPGHCLALAAGDEKAIHVPARRVEIGEHDRARRLVDGKVAGVGRDGLGEHAQGAAVEVHRDQIRELVRDPIQQHLALEDAGNVGDVAGVLVQRAQRSALGIDLVDAERVGAQLSGLSVGWSHLGTGDAALHEHPTRRQDPGAAGVGAACGQDAVVVARIDQDEPGPERRIAPALHLGDDQRAPPAGQQCATHFAVRRVLDARDRRRLRGRARLREVQGALALAGLRRPERDAGRSRVVQRSPGIAGRRATIARRGVTRPDQTRDQEA